jgi:hypothetical protein
MLAALVFLAPLAAQTPRFIEHTIATGLKGGYQVVAADINHDGKPDLIALASGMPDLVWYENPTWERHVIVSGLNHMINCAAEDIDADGIPEIAIAWNFASNAANSIGNVGILRHDGDPSRPWKLQEIDKLTTSHRLRWADIDGSRHKVLVDTPLTGANAAPPEYKGQVPIVYYRPSDWKRRVISEENFGVQHGLLVARWMPGDTRDSILTASFSGIDLFAFDGGNWTRTEIAKGDPAACPKCGSSDIALGHLGRSSFIAAIEPWHGNQTVVYDRGPKGWNRHVIDNSLKEGHTILTAGFDRSGRDAIVAGFRGAAGHGVFLYELPSYSPPHKLAADPRRLRTPPTFQAPHAWKKTAIDSDAMAASSCIAVDLNGDRIPELACIGSATANLKWYQYKPISR